MQIGCETTDRTSRVSMHAHGCTADSTAYRLARAASAPIRYWKHEPIRSGIVINAKTFERKFAIGNGIAERFERTANLTKTRVYNGIDLLAAARLLAWRPSFGREAFP